MSGGHSSHDPNGAQRANLLRPRCVGAERPRTQLQIYLSILAQIDGLQ